MIPLFNLPILNYLSVEGKHGHLKINYEKLYMYMQFYDIYQG
jgi:hypothetical protein